MIDRAVREVLRVNNVQMYEKQYVNRKFRNVISNKIGTEARAAFTAGATTGLIKIVLGYNYYGKRHIMINDIGTTSTYP